ncbi:MAG TPA: hypothetical protein PK528_14065, partial [Syntrophorhabdus sp.]|nr:hypothetical protein [Syntrophorhabdus sp.]
MIKPLFVNMPNAIVELPQWVNWKYVPREGGGKPTKPPYQPNGKLAESNNPLTWSNFLEVKAAADRFDGVGFVLTREVEIVGLDFDNCRCPVFDAIDPEIASGLNVVLPRVGDYVRRLDSYTELSPSGKGLHIFLKGSLPVDGKKKGDYEAYQSGRYVTVTGHVLEGTPTTIEHRQTEVDAFYKDVFGTLEEPPKREKQSRTESAPGDWQNMIEKAFNSKSGPEIRCLWNGNFSAYPSQSEADMALCSHLAFWFNGDAVLMDIAFRESGLYRDKWDEKHYGNGQTYG